MNNIKEVMPATLDATIVDESVRLIKASNSEMVPGLINQSILRYYLAHSKKFNNKELTSEKVALYLQAALKKVF